MKIKNLRILPVMLFMSLNEVMNINKPKKNKKIPEEIIIHMFI